MHGRCWCLSAVAFSSLMMKSVWATATSCGQNQMVCTFVHSHKRLPLPEFLIMLVKSLNLLPSGPLATVESYTIPILFIPFLWFWQTADLNSHPDTMALQSHWLYNCFATGHSVKQDTPVSFTAPCLLPVGAAEVAWLFLPVWSTWQAWEDGKPAGEDQIQWNQWFQSWCPAPRETMAFCPTS